MEILWADSSLEDFAVRIEPAGCDYHFFAIRKGTEAAEDIFFSIDRSMRVNSAPECWWLGELGNCSTEEGRADLPSTSAPRKIRLPHVRFGAPSAPSLLKESGSTIPGPTRFQLRI
jgi:hypothetical protein